MVHFSMEILEQQRHTRGVEIGGENEAELDELATGDGDATNNGFKDRRAGEGYELVKMVVAQRPPPEPLNLNSHSVVEEEYWTSTLELENHARQQHHHPTTTAISRENERHTLLGYGDCA
ncbi:hypothetical protein PIB30_088297 [Stylosanthes scabra]|uniref:Uncharacterized protein n=1 Tax=Stylosanthes scabra TaxID=79078 RepID=A0ABU6ZSC5_9FABA|nr:hypothetical protein [Stylosanthes scabra]